MREAGRLEHRAALERVDYCAPRALHPAPQVVDEAGLRVRKKRPFQWYKKCYKK